MTLEFRKGRVGKSYPCDVDADQAREILRLAQLTAKHYGLAEICYPLTIDFVPSAIMVMTKPAPGEGRVFATARGRIKLPHGGMWGKLWDAETRTIYETTLSAWCEAQKLRYHSIEWFFDKGRLIGVPAPDQNHPDFKGTIPSRNDINLAIKRGSIPRSKCTLCAMICENDPAVKKMAQCWDCPEPKVTRK